MTINKKFLYCLTIFAVILLAGCDTGEVQTGGKQDTPAIINGGAQSKISTTALVTVSQQAAAPSQQSTQAAIRNIDPIYLVEKKTNPAGTKVFEVYSSLKAYCSAGFLNSDKPVYCLLKVTDLKTNKVILNLASDELAIFHYNKFDFAAPSDWYDDSTLYIEGGFGDAGIVSQYANKFNLVTKKLTAVYSSNSYGVPGMLFMIGDKKLLFHQDYGDADLIVYSVLTDDKESSALYKTVGDTQVPDLTKLKELTRLKNADYGKSDVYVMNKGIVAVDTAGKSYVYDLQGNVFREGK